MMAHSASKDGVSRVSDYGRCRKSDQRRIKTLPMPDQPSSRRRFQFRLRTLMIVVTLLAVACAYIGWQAKIVRERRIELERTVDLRVVGIDGSDKWGIIPWVRRVLGDKPIAT